MNPTINEDNQLLQALQRGEETAFDRLFRKYYPLCCAYGSRFVNPEDAKELAGDAIAWLWEHRQDLRIETSLSSYLLKSVQNRALNLRQQQERKAHADTRYYEKMEEMIRDSVDELHYRELSALVKRAIDDLPSEYREVFVRHRFGGRKYKEIADELGVTVPIVAYRIQQTTRLLQQKIGPIVQMTAPAFLCQMLLNHT